MKERPIIFNQEMVKAILSGRKTQTRRLVKTDRPPCEVGDILWVRETFGYDGDRMVYREGPPAGMVWRKGKRNPTIPMRREEARIELEVLEVKLQQLGDITCLEALQEGIKESHYLSDRPYVYKDYLRKSGYVSDPRVSFISLFRSIYGIDIKSSVPVWASTFRICKIIDGKKKA